jgi:hypothetical protein
MTSTAEVPASTHEFSVALFEAFWRAPRFDEPADVLAHDIRGYWPGRSQPRVGREDYEAPLRRLLQLVPDFRLEVTDHATRGEVTFIRWVARGSWRGQLLDFDGVDCIRQRGGQVIENRIFSSHPLIDEIASTP